VVYASGHEHGDGVACHVEAGDIEVMRARYVEMVLRHSINVGCNTAYINACCSKNSWTRFVRLNKVP